MSSLPWYNERLRGKLQREIAWAITSKVNDPRIPDIVTTTNINLSPDSRNATVFVSVYGSDEEKENAVAALQHAAPFIQRCCLSRIKIKNFPKLFFKLDSSFDRSDHITTLLEHVKDDLA